MVIESELLHSVPYWPAPAKLNLFLHIVGRRPDGYHLLQTVFQFVDLVDELRFYARPAGVLERIRGADGVAAEADLVIKAAEVLRAHLETQGRDPRRLPGVAISLTKRIPMQAGLGGGSSDAATTLLALNQVWEAELPTEVLARLGLRLGADVPVFVRGHNAWAEGVGERLTPIDLPQAWFVVVKPPISVSTSEIFLSSELTRDTPVTTIRAFREDPTSVSFHNDCQAVVCRRYPTIAAALGWLSERCRTADAMARLTGTGACVFARCPDLDQARQVVAQLPPELGCGFAVQGLNRSPAHDALAMEQVPRLA